MTNPYQSPRDPDSETTAPTASPVKPRSPLLLWFAIAWVGVVIALTSGLLSNANSNAQPWDSFALKVITTAFTCEAVFVLCFFPRGRGRWVAVSLALLLVVGQISMWLKLP